MPKHIWIPEYITNGVTESGSSGTLRKDLPDAEQISMLMLEFRVTNASSHTQTRTIFDIITKIEVIADGVKVIASAEPEILSYLAFVAQGGVVPDHRIFLGGSAVQRLHLPIYFGRHPWDEDWMLDTSLYKKVELVVTWSLDTSEESSGSFQHTITYWRPVDKLSPVGVVRSREVRNESSPGSSAETDHKLDVTYPWHYLGVRVVDLDQDINTNLSTIKLNIDAGRLLLLNVDADEAYYMDKLRYAHARGYVLQPVVTGQATIATLAEWGFPRGVVPVVLGARIPTITSVAGEQAVLAVYTDAGVQASDAVPVTVEVNAQNPHKCLTLLDGRDVPFDAPAHSEAKVTYKTGSTGPDNLITFIQELVKGAL